MTDYPAQTTNPARDLYNFWYGIIQHTSPHSLVRTDERSYHNPAAFSFDHRSLFVDPDDWIGGKPALHLGGVMRLWPNGHFQPLLSIRRGRYWGSELRTYTKHTFLQWSWAANGKVLIVQDTPRHNDHVPNQWLNEKDFERRRPYLTLSNYNLLDSNTVYRLKNIGNGDWIIAPMYTHRGGWSQAQLRAQTAISRSLLTANYKIASDRYDRWQRRDEMAKIREGAAPKPRKISSLDRINIEDMLRRNLTVYEPKVGPGGKPLPQQLQLLTQLEVARGR